MGSYERACSMFDFPKVFDSTGSSLAPDGSKDAAIKLQGLDSFEYNLEDANRDAVSGEVPALHPADTDDENEGECFSQASGSDDDSGSGGETEPDSEDEGPPYCCPPEFSVLENCPPDDDGRLQQIAHRFGPDGWFIGRVQRKITASCIEKYNGMFAATYPATRKEIF